MRRYVLALTASFSLMTSAAALCASPASAAAAGQEIPISVTINGIVQNYEQPPVIENGYTLVPMRDIFESLGAFVQWDDKKKEATATVYGSKMTIGIGTTAASLNGKEQKLEQAAIIEGGKAMVPARFVSEALGAKVEWNGTSRTVAITKPPVPIEVDVPAEAARASGKELPKEQPVKSPPELTDVKTTPFKKVDKKWKTFNTKYFQIYAYETNDDLFILSKRLDAMYDQLSAKFGNKMSFLLPVYFLNSEDYLKVRDLDWSAAVWSPSEQAMFIRVGNKDDTIESLFITFKHELTHALTVSNRDIASSRIPIWFAEGVATYYEKEAPFYDAHRDRVLYTAYKSNSLVGLKNFDTTNKNLKNDDLSKVYAEAQSIYGYLVETYGEAKVNGLFFSPLPFEEALAKLTGGKTKAQLENDWLAYLKASYAKDAVSFGILYYEKGDRYIGEVKHGYPNGKGKMYRDFKLVYDGEYKEGKYEGSGTYYFASGGRYEGQLAGGSLSGKGSMYDDKGKLYYTGDLRNDKPDGQGVMYFEDGTRYEGGFTEGKISGAGKLYSSDGRILRDMQ